MQTGSLEQLLKVRRRLESRLLRDFAELLSHPNSAHDPDGLARNAEFLRTAFQRRGLESRVQTLPGAAPLVIAELDRPDSAPMLGIYAHYDGQPVEPERWTHPPWQPSLLSRALDVGGERLELPAAGEAVDPDWRIYARSAADDKVAIAAVLGALDVLAEAGTEPAVRLKILLEGEEEIGSPHLASHLRRARDRLEADAWLVLDGSVHASGRPQIVLGVRGFLGLEMTVYGPVRPLHSGTYGNWAPNPALELARLLTSMRAEDGRILIEGFYDSARPVTPRERELLAALSGPDDALRYELPLGGTPGPEERLAESVLRPTLNVRGLRAGGVGPEARNEIPDRATASLDLRLVPDDPPARMLQRIESHLRHQGCTVVRDPPDAELRRRRGKIVHLEVQAGYPAVRISPDHPLVAHVAGAVEAVDGRPPFLVPTVGGSLPLHALSESLETELLIVPLAHPDGGQHGPDENLRVGDLLYGVDLALALFCRPPMP